MSLAFEEVLVPSPALPATSAGSQAEPPLHVAVVFTSDDATLAALRKAATLTGPPDGRITLMVPQVVPYPLPLATPPVLLDWSERRLQMIVRESPVETAVSIYLCRDRVEMLNSALRPHALVVIGGRKRWWFTAEQRLARQLRRAGHEVLFAETE